MRFVSPESFATMFELEPELVTKMIQRGDLRAIKIGDTYRIAESEVAAFVRRHFSRPDGVEAQTDREARLRAIRELQEFRKRLSLGGLKVRDLIEEGRM